MSKSEARRLQKRRTLRELLRLMTGSGAFIDELAEGPDLELLRWSAVWDRENEGAEVLL